MNKAIRALYIKKLGVEWNNKIFCGRDSCDGLCVGYKFNFEDRILTEKFERKYGVKNGKA